MPVLATENNCTGCSACGNMCPHYAIKMNPDKEGFLMPHIDVDKCVECKLCEKACPIVNNKDLKYPEVKEAYAFWDRKTRIESSSGGAFSAIAGWILNKGGVVFGASWYEGFRCMHSGRDSLEGLAELRGSKYLQSDINKTYLEAREVLQSGRYVLFTGTPCQIAGLRSFLIKPYEKLVTVDLVCHGVPSNILFLNYISKLKTEYSKYSSAVGFEFRNRRGWGMAPASIRKDGHCQYLTGIANIYMKAFDKGVIFRESCYDCRFNGLSRVGDITIADFWGIGTQGIPFRHDVTKGVSLMLINSAVGQEIIESFEGCFIEKRPLKEALKYNHNIKGSSKRPSDRNEVIEAFNDPRITLGEINSRFHFIGKGIKDRLTDMLVRTGLFWPIKSLINKFRSL